MSRSIALEDAFGESTESWTTLFEGLRERGLKNVAMLVADGAQGIWKADYYFASLFWDVTRKLKVGTEVGYRQTAYMAPNTDNDAWVYCFRMRLKF